MNAFYAAWQITSPVLWAILAGLLLKKFNVIGVSFVKRVNQLIFMVVLPATLFLSIASQPDIQWSQLKLALFGVSFTLAIILLLHYTTRHLFSRDFQGVWIQSAYRGNMGVVGLSLCIGAYGEAGLPATALYLALNTIAYNVTAVILLNADKSRLLSQLLRNPLIISTCAGLGWNLLLLENQTLRQIPLVDMVSYALPLALITTGASLSFKSIRSNKKPLIYSLALKLMVLPFIAVLLAYISGFEGMELGILLIMVATPSAAASYVMAQQMTGHGNFAAETVALSTLLSPVTLTVALILANGFFAVTT